MQLEYLVCFLVILSALASLSGLAIHSYQCALLKEYQSMTGIPDWVTAEHWQYLIWYIEFSLLLLTSIAMCVHKLYFGNTSKHSFDRRVNPICLLISLVSVITAVALNSSEPWTDGYVQFKRKGSLITSCFIFDSPRDQTHNILYQRCILDDSVLICAILLCFIWIVLTSLTIWTCILDKRDKKTQSDCFKKTLNWGRYVPDPPSSIYTASQAAYTGLLTPYTSLTKEKHFDFYQQKSLSIHKALPSDFDLQASRSNKHFSAATLVDKSHLNSDMKPTSLYRNMSSSKDRYEFSEKLILEQEGVEGKNSFHYRTNQTFTPPLPLQNNSLTDAAITKPLYTRSPNPSFNSNHDFFSNQY